MAVRGGGRGSEETGRARLNLVDGRTSGTWTSHRQEVFEEESIRFTTNFPSASVEFIHGSSVGKRNGFILVVACGVHMPLGCGKQWSIITHQLLHLNSTDEDTNKTDGMFLCGEMYTIGTAPRFFERSSRI